MNRPYGSFLIVTPGADPITVAVVGYCAPAT